MRNKVRTITTAGAIATIGGAALLGWPAIAAADAGDTPGSPASEWCEDTASHDNGADAEQHARFHAAMASHMAGPMGMHGPMGMGSVGDDHLDRAMGTGWGAGMAESGATGSARRR